MNPQRVAILGASDRADRFAYRAFQLLRQAGHEALPVHPTLSDIEGVPVVPDLASIQGPVDTLTLYVGPARLEAMADALITLRPGRVLFNPGTESALVQSALDAAGIPWVEDCTLVMLQQGRF